MVTLHIMPIPFKIYGENMSKTKVAFFFGAGAEGEGNFEISSGIDFLRNTIVNYKKNFEGVTKNLDSYFKYKYYNGEYLYRKDTIDGAYQMLKTFIVQKIENGGEDFNDCLDEVDCFLTDEEFNKLTKNISENKKNSLNKKSEKKDEILNEFREILYKQNVDKEIKSKLLKYLFYKDDKCKIDMVKGMAGVIESYFHTIIDPNKYGIKRFSKIFNYYWICYFKILDDVFKFLRKNKVEWVEEYIKDGKLDYLKILTNIFTVTKKLYEEDLDVFSENTYYGIIKNNLKDDPQNLECVGVATTNYYKFCTVLGCDNIAYLNGQLKLFEFPEFLEVDDFTSCENNRKDLFFPFIFGQSLIKPIIEPLQILEFDKFRKMLFGDNGADVLVVIGFNLNEDDNHINAYLHKFLTQNKRIVVLKGENDNKSIDKKLKVDEDKIEYVTVSYKKNSNKEIVDAIFKQITNQKHA